MENKSPAESIFSSKDLGIKSDLGPYVFEVRCPHLGLKNDRATILGFPNVQNHCFRHDRPVPIDLKMQTQLCLTTDYESCAIFQQTLSTPEHAKTMSGQGRKADDWLATSTEAWLRRARPVLFAIPVVLLIIAALVWWPAPGTSVKDNTSNAAPLQKLTTPSEPDPDIGSQVGEAEREHNQANLKNDSSAAARNHDELETALQADESSTGVVVEDEAPGPESEGFRVLTYD